MKGNKKQRRNSKGITLIALVITIIVLIILAGVSIAMLTGENGILTQAQKAKNETEKTSEEEQAQLEELESAITGNSYLKSKGVNAPALKDGMELVTYNEETDKWETNNSSSAYDYVGKEEAGDNNSSRWANARVTIDGVESYFVWIPRYAYKITYNEDKTGGTIDIKFLIGTTDQYYDDNGNIQTAKRATTGQEDTTSDYYVHPVFTNNVDLGGWSSELTGIWVGKYESSLVNKTAPDTAITSGTNIIVDETNNTDKAIAVKPNMSSWRNCTIGNFFTSAKAYSTSLNSHMLKNSEWGAVAYLTESKYGRNGTEVTQNTNDSYLTANGDIDTNTKQSSTGNITGIYDLSGGASEYVPGYYTGGGSYLTNYGSSFADGSSDEYSTAYTGTSASTAYKSGDATYETSGWHGDYTYFVYSNRPFFERGGAENSDSTDVGVFDFSYNNGSSTDYDSFRLCLAVM